MTRSLEYLRPTACITLREGIQELRNVEGADNDAAQNVSPELTDILAVHDAIHVLFACSTDLTGEVSAHIWKIFGTTMTFAEMHRVNQHADHRQVLAQIGHRQLLFAWMRNIPHLAMTLTRISQMTQQWPADSYRDFLDTPLVTLRQQLGIKLPKLHTAINLSQSNGGAAVRHIRARVAD